MAQVTLTKDWTDPKGQVHHAGEVLAVDDLTAGQLAAQGVCDWVGPSAKDPKTDGWVGPS
ncbi:hypothetical protein Lfu02_50860 [Longispora fulva]|uniref:Uncharacterized protein n=1 Tax=Longispora fulva TaxID=619741 RepID=A0A8J7KZH0_9ACTN|nr:hypothetical protein [Longispora fulva]MBG6141017.1 hypothetical protein [Longispora fulva]GIG60714.1 hypothetical protein Lfu02_50860 [Longispora fulva]